MLTHEQLVDIVWKDQIEPMLLARFPGSTAGDLRRAHSFGYGGCLVQDLGYYPFGNRFFSDLTHYVRSGAFVQNLLVQSSNLDEYAFALGALAHYSGDSVGHPSVNHAVALAFPKLRAKYGEEVTYEDNPKAHIRTEFGFDLVQVAKNRYTSDRYHDFIGFEVAKPLLERAFFSTYHLKLEDVIDHLDLAIGTFRRAVSQVIPEMTRVSLLTFRPEIVRETPDFNKRQFLFNLSRADYEKQWGTEYRRPGPLARILAFLMRLVPKVGPLKALDFKIPAKETEDLYVQSVNKTVDRYRALLADAAQGRLHLRDLDLDTGNSTQLGEYRLSDKTYAQLLDRLSKRGLDRIPSELHDNITFFFAGPGRPGPNRREQKAWSKTLEQLRQLKAADGRPNQQFSE